MYQLKGFASIKPLITNVPGQDALLGEITTYSMTYTRERGEYYNPDITGIKLVSLSSTEVGVGKVIVDQSIADHALTVIDFIYNYALSHTGEIYKEDLLQALILRFQSEASGFLIGDIVGDGEIWMPEWVNWSMDGSENDIRIWFSDSAFRAQFDDFEITVVPPLENLDQFFQSPSEIQVALNARSNSEMMDEVQIAKEFHPETVIRLETYDYVNPNYPGLRIPTNWYVLIYGIAGDNIDAIKDAIVEYILDNSTHTEEEWKTIFPEIFKRTEFRIFPRWDLYAIPNMAIQSGIHSPMLTLTEGLQYMRTKLPEATPSFLDNFTSSFTHPFKSITCLALAGEENIDGKYSLTDHFPDYIHTATTSLDFNRMSQNTKDWTLMIERLLIIAEKMTVYSNIPPSTRRLVRNGILYIVQRFGNVQYLVAAKGNG